jgi:hypothetical protein
MIVAACMSRGPRGVDERGEQSPRAPVLASDTVISMSTWTPVLIVIRGNSGSGKTTLASHSSRWLIWSVQARTLGSSDRDGDVQLIALGVGERPPFVAKPAVVPSGLTGTLL